MLERYFIRPETIDRIRSSWIGAIIEQYVAWLAEHRYAARNVFRRVPILRQFGEFARRRGAERFDQLPEHVNSFVDAWILEHSGSTRKEGRKAGSEARGPVEQMLQLAVPGFCGRGRARCVPTPFADRVGRFFDYLREERGLRPLSILHYKHHLDRFESFLAQVGCSSLTAISPPVLGAFVADSSLSLGVTGLRDRCGVLRVFLRYLHREQLISKDLSLCVESPRTYRLSTLPRSITWDEVRLVLETVDRRSAAGKEDPERERGAACAVWGTPADTSQGVLHAA